MKYCILIIALILFSCQTSNEQANSGGELTQETANTETKTSEKKDSSKASSPEPSFKPEQLSGEWFSEGNEGVVDHWLEFDNASKNFYSWLDDELLKSIPAGTFELENEILTLNHIEFNEAEKYFEEAESINQNFW